MTRPPKTITILMADDDADDRMMTKEAFEESRIANDLRFVVDGEECMSYLRNPDEPLPDIIFLDLNMPKKDGREVLGEMMADPEADAPRPGIILLDLNMPKKDGREALAEIKMDDSLRSIPVVVLTTSKDEEDIFRTYDLGVSSFITKPVTFAGLVDAMRVWQRYWFEIVELVDAQDA